MPQPICNEEPSRARTLRAYGGPKECEKRRGGWKRPVKSLHDGQFGEWRV